VNNPPDVTTPPFNVELSTKRELIVLFGELDNVRSTWTLTEVIRLFYFTQTDLRLTVFLAKNEGMGFPPQSIEKSR
jgi:hypothetical protein